jgi:hypothetical protein
VCIPKVELAASVPLTEPKVARHKVMSQVYIITPELKFRGEILPRLPEVVRQVGGLEILGIGRTGIKVRLVADGSLQKDQFPAEIQEHCFFEPARKFTVAG